MVASLHLHPRRQPPPRRANPPSLLPPSSTGAALVALLPRRHQTGRGGRRAAGQGRGGGGGEGTAARERWLDGKDNGADAGAEDRGDGSQWGRPHRPPQRAGDLGGEDPRRSAEAGTSAVSFTLPAVAPSTPATTARHQGCLPPPTGLLRPRSLSLSIRHRRAVASSLPPLTDSDGGEAGCPWCATPLSRPGPILRGRGREPRRRRPCRQAEQRQPAAATTENRPVLMALAFSPSAMGTASSCKLSHNDGC